MRRHQRGCRVDACLVLPELVLLWARVPQSESQRQRVLRRPHHHRTWRTRSTESIKRHRDARAGSFALQFVRSSDHVASRTVALLKAWTAAANRMTQGAAAGQFGPTGGSYDGPPDDTGEAQGLPPSGLTITFGFGPSLFEGKRAATLGTAGKRPPALADIPAFPGDTLDAAQSDGDLCIQACANDPQVAVHAVRNLARIAFGTAHVRWSQLGFGRTSSTSTSQQTPRNLFGFKDGTANLKAEDPGLLNDHVWAAAADGAPWMAGGSYLVARRIRMIVETWDRTSLREQEAIVGATKGEGAPLSGGTEFTGARLCSHWA